MVFTKTIPSLLLFFLLTFTFSSCQNSDQDEEDLQTCRQHPIFEIKLIC